jgi:hypothetical protein
MRFEVFAMLEAELDTFGKTSSLAFQKSVNNGRSSKFLLASKQGEKHFEKHLFPSLVWRLLNGNNFHVTVSL